MTMEGLKLLTKCAYYHIVLRPDVCCFYFQPLPAMLKNPFELNRECLPVRDLINDDIESHHRFDNLTNSLCAKIGLYGRYHIPLSIVCFLIANQLFMTAGLYPPNLIHLSPVLFIPIYSFLGPVSKCMRLCYCDVVIRADTRDAIHSIMIW